MHNEWTWALRLEIHSILGFVVTVSIEYSSKRTEYSKNLHNFNVKQLQYIICQPLNHYKRKFYYFIIQMPQLELWGEIVEIPWLINRPIKHSFGNLYYCYYYRRAIILCFAKLKFVY